jgi:hypothetical protein
MGGPCNMPPLLLLLQVLQLPLLLLPLPPATLVCTTPLLSHPLLVRITLRICLPSFVFAPPTRLCSHSPALVCVCGCSSWCRCCLPSHPLLICIAQHIRPRSPLSPAFIRTRPPLFAFAAVAAGAAVVCPPSFALPLLLLPISPRCCS